MSKRELRVAVPTTQSDCPKAQRRAGNPRKWGRTNIMRLLDLLATQFLKALRSTKINGTNAHTRASRSGSNDAVGLSRSPKTGWEPKEIRGNHIMRLLDLLATQFSKALRSTKINRTGAHRRASRGDSNDAVGLSRSLKTRWESKEIGEHSIIRLL
jgi:hypothetical protein